MRVLFEADRAQLDDEHWEGMKRGIEHARAEAKKQKVTGGEGHGRP